MEPSEKILCKSCDHADVCAKKNEYRDAQEAVNNLMVHFEDKRSTYLRSIDWISGIQLQCKYYKPMSRVAFI